MGNGLNNADKEVGMPGVPVETGYFHALAVARFSKETIIDKIAFFCSLTRQELRERMKTDESIRLVVARFFELMDRGKIKSVDPATMETNRCVVSCIRLACMLPDPCRTSPHRS